MTVRLNPYLTFNGNAKEAVAFYEKALEAKVITVQTFGDMPAHPDMPPMAPEMKDRILHAHLKVGETDLMFSDTMAGMPYQLGNQITTAFVTDDAAQAKRVYEALAEGGTVNMPLQETFWSPAYGMVTDKYGMAWQISTEAKR